MVKSCVVLLKIVALLCGILVVTVLTGSTAPAQEPAPANTSLAEAAARRFPQPVRVGDLIDRSVLQPLESRPLLGRVAQVV